MSTPRICYFMGFNMSGKSTFSTFLECPFDKLDTAKITVFLFVGLHFILSNFKVIGKK